MEGTEYRGVTKDLPDTTRPPLPPGVNAGGHGGSHGHLSNEFVLSILQDRTPLVNIAQALNMTVCGIVANESALKDGERLNKHKPAVTLCFIAKVLVSLYGQIN